MLKKIPGPGKCLLFLQKKFGFQPNLRGALYYSPGHFHSPLLDIKSLGPNAPGLSFDGPEYWEQIDLRQNEQRSYYIDLLENFPLLPYPKHKSGGYHYFSDNRWFGLSDAFTFSGIIRREKPRRIVEVGSGFSSAVALDTLAYTNQSASLTLIEPFPNRLYSLLSPDDKSSITLLAQLVQEVSLSVFESLDAQDVLFIDSSHVAKIGSDVTFLLLRVLPRLKRGVLVHFHDIFYPFSYPAHWIREGKAWNESVFLRAFLVGNREFQIVAFNSYAGYVFPEVFRERLPAFLNNTGGSIWLRKVA
jgi:predicted O-methyltransferase YrrM